VPFVTVSRDKRGYEYICLFEASNRRSSRPRLLYWFRTPPGIRVGREPFDEQVRRALEAQNPGVMFDWTKLVSEGLPPPEAENWRERRRAEREAKRARRGDEGRGAAGDDEPETDDEQVNEPRASEAPVPVGEKPVDDVPSQVTAAGGSPATSQKPKAASGAGESVQVGRHRRRNRGGRRQRSLPTRDPLVPQAGIHQVALVDEKETSGAAPAISDTADAGPPEK
jgi:hypothetical protein